MAAGRGVFITLEGIDGAGKSTHLDFIEGILSAAGHKVVCTREPGGTRLGERLRQIVLGDAALSICAEAETLLIFAARAQHVLETIGPALSAGQSVLCDRFTDATYAYQGGGRGLARERIALLEQWVQRGVSPDLTLLFDLPVDVALARARGRGEADRFEREALTFLEAVRNSYLETADRDPARVRIIHADQGVAEVRQQVQQAIGEFIGYLPLE